VLPHVSLFRFNSAAFGASGTQITFVFHALLAASGEIDEKEWYLCAPRFGQKRARVDFLVVHNAAHRAIPRHSFWSPVQYLSGVF